MSEDDDIVFNNAPAEPDSDGVDVDGDGDADVDNGDGRDEPLSRRIRKRTASFQQRAMKVRNKRRAKKRSRQLRRQRTRRNLRESADNVVNAVTGRELDDFRSPSEDDDTGDDGDGESFLERIGAADDGEGSGGGDDGSDPVFLDVDGDGDLDAVFPTGGSDTDNGGSSSMQTSGQPAFEVTVDVDEANVELPGVEMSGETLGGGGQSGFFSGFGGGGGTSGQDQADADQPDIFGGFGGGSDTSGQDQPALFGGGGDERDDDDFPPIL